jgi:ankyrin repeat protein
MSSNQGKAGGKMSAEQQKAKMNEDRGFLQKFAEAALGGDSRKLEQYAKEYGIKHNVTPFQVYKDFKDGSKRTVLHFACASNCSVIKEKEDIVIHLLKNCNLQPSEVESLLLAQDKDGLTPLMILCNTINDKSYERIKSVLDIGGSKMALMKSEAGATAFHYASGAGATNEILKLLYESGKKALTSLSESIGSPLHWASGVLPPKDYSNTIKCLINDFGLDVNIINNKGLSSLMTAAASGNDSHAKALVECRADRGFILNGNNTVFHIAADLNLIETLSALLKDCESDSFKATTENCLALKNEKGETPLDMATIRGHIDCVKLLAGILDDEKAKAYIKSSQEVLKKKCEETIVESCDEDGTTELTPQQVAIKILKNKPTISEENKQIAAELKAKGNNYYAKGEWDSAVFLYSEAIEKNPIDETFYSNRSACYLALNKDNEALYDAIIARTLKPEWVKGCFRVSKALLALERFEDAAVSAFEGMSLDKDNQELKSLFQKCIKKGRKEHQEKEKVKKGDGLKKQTFFET